MNKLNDINTKIKEIDKTLHSPIRLNIMLILNDIEYCDTVFMVRQLKISWGNLSTHISVLRDKEYILSEKKVIDNKFKTLLSITPLGEKKLLLYKENILSLVR